MENRTLHIFRNTPFGRETLIASANFCRQAKVELDVYIPAFHQFLMYFTHGVVTVDLDRAFLNIPETAAAHVDEILKPFELRYRIFKPFNFTAGKVPELPAQYGYMTCPRSISDLSTKIGLGYIGPKVRHIIRQAHFPVFIPTPVYKEWNSITCFFGGSKNSIRSVSCAIELAEKSEKPLHLFTQDDKKGRKHYEQILAEAGFLEKIENDEIGWQFFDRDDFHDNLYQVPHDSLTVVGAYGHGLVKELFFGSKLEMIQTVLPNPMLIVGPHFRD
jgi:hypothetical protein